MLLERGVGTPPARGTHGGAAGCRLLLFCAIGVFFSISHRRRCSYSYVCFNARTRPQIHTTQTCMHTYIHTVTFIPDSTHTHTYMQTARQTVRQTDRRADRRTDSETEIQRERERESARDRGRDRETEGESSVVGEFLPQSRCKAISLSCLRFWYTGVLCVGVLHLSLFGFETCL